MAAGSGVAEARGRLFVAACLAGTLSVARAGDSTGAVEPVAPVPGTAWQAPGEADRAEPFGADRGPVRERLLERRTERGGPVAGRLRDRLRGESRPSAAGGGPEAAADPAPAVWPEPVTLVAQLSRLGTAPAGVGAWATATLAHLRTVGGTAGPEDPAAVAALVTLHDDVDSGMTLAERLDDAALATDLRRAALAVARRATVWREATAACLAATGTAGSGDIAATLVGESTAATTGRLLAALERFESRPGADAAAQVRTAVDALGPAPEVAGVRRAVGDHYLAPNLRVVVHRDFVSRMLPEATVTSGPMQDFVLGRPVRGTRRIEQSTDVRFVPDADQIRCELLVGGVVTSRTVAESGPVALHSRGTAEFTVRKPVTLSAGGLALGRAVGAASNRSQLADIDTDFDSVPIMGPLIRSIARNQHDDLQAEATREVNDKIVTRACREIDAQAEPKFREAAERVRKQVWEPLVGLGLEPQAVALETTDDTATARLRLAGAGQLAAHTPRPRGPANAIFSVQVHESALNNACQGLELAGRRLTVENLVRTVCGRLGVPPRIPDDLPADVEIAFASTEPLRIECRDGLVHVRMALDCISSGRRSWYDIVAQVAYRPVMAGPQVLLEREGPVRLCGEGQQGRMEIALRTIFGKMFPKERPVQLVPARIVTDRRLAGIQAVQAVSVDGWFALALAEPAVAATPAATRPVVPARRGTRR